MSALEEVVGREGRQEVPEDVDSLDYVNWVIGHVCRYFCQNEARKDLSEEDGAIVRTLREAPAGLKNSQVIHILRVMDPTYEASIAEDADALCRGNGGYMACLGQVVSARASNMERLQPDLKQALVLASWRRYEA